MYELISKYTNTEILLTDGEKNYRGIHSMAKSMCNNETSVLVLHMKRRHFDRYAQIFDVPWKVYTFSELKAEGKVKAAVSSQKSKRAANEVRCNYLEINDGKMSLHTQGVLDLTDPDFEYYQTRRPIKVSRIFDVATTSRS